MYSLSICQNIVKAAFLFILLFLKVHASNAVQINLTDTISYYVDENVEVNVCDADDKNSEKYCDCKEDVVSCDFSKYPNNPKFKVKTNLELIASWPSDQVQRFCVCGAPWNLNLELTHKFLSKAHHKLSRIDIYNIHGEMSIPLDFKINFSGDLYMAKIKYLREIGSWNIGRGYTLDLNDTRGLHCCSNITTPPLASPAFFMEDSTVGAVRNGGINSDHLWNTIVFNRVTFESMDSYAIKLDYADNLNASFTNCRFSKLANSSIAVNRIVNFLIAHSVFEENCNAAAIGARGASDSSTIALLENTFLGRNHMEVDGKTVAVWFNKFAVWDNETFNHLNSSVHSVNGLERTVSIELNTVLKYLLGPTDFPKFGANDHVFFSKNIISACDCQLLSSIKLPAIMQNSSNWCDAHESRHSCLLTIEESQTECQKSIRPNWAQHCTENLEKSLNLTEVEKELNAFNVHIESTFVNDMLKYVSNPFWMSRLQLRNGLASEKLVKEATAAAGARFSSSICLVIIVCILS